MRYNELKNPDWFGGTKSLPVEASGAVAITALLSEAVPEIKRRYTSDFASTPQHLGSKCTHLQHPGSSLPERSRRRAARRQAEKDLQNASQVQTLRCPGLPVNPRYSLTVESA